MNALRTFAAKHPVLFVLAVTVAWLVALLAIMALASGVFHQPYGAITSAAARLAVTVGTLALLWRLGWLQAAGVTRPGTWPAWLLAAGGLAYAVSASLYAFYGRPGFDFTGLLQHPASGSIILSAFMAGLSEEILFRGLVLYALVGAWGNTSRGIIGSALLTSMLFALLHLTQVFTDQVAPSAALLLALQTAVVALWWAALVRLGGSVWPVVVLHVAGNALVALQGLTLTPGASSYLWHLCFSLPLGLLGIWLLVRGSR